MAAPRHQQQQPEPEPQHASSQPDEDADDVLPPPLHNIGDQLHAAQLSTSLIGTAGLKAGELRVAAVTDGTGELHTSCQAATTQQQAGGNSKPQALKRGFFDARPKASKQAATHSSSKATMPTLKASTQQQQQPVGGKSIPDFLRVPLSVQEQQLGAFKSQLLSALQPTPDTMSEVASDSALMAGFDDPDVMAAVAEVARDPKAFAKHATNPKVQAFYRRMGGLVGARLERLGGEGRGGGGVAGALKQGAAAAGERL